MAAMNRLLVVLMIFALALPAFSQEKELPSAPSASGAASKPASGVGGSEHRFWDKTNALLFAGVGGARFFDYGSTIWMRHRGVNEWLLTNDIVDNHAAFAAIELAGTAASIGISYAFHKTGHHTLERAVSVVHIGVATGGAIRNFTLP
jgi:hypothetical protein